MKKDKQPKTKHLFDSVSYRKLLQQPFAHRGVHNVYPENSMPAFEQALNLHLGIELDIHLSSDGKLVVFHDDNLRRMTGVNEYIKLLPYTQIREYKLNNTQYGIPLLSDVLALVNGKVPLLIEIKTNNNMKKLVPALKQLLDNYQGDVFIQSFDPFALRRCYKLMPNILRGQLSSFFKNDKLKFYKKIPIKKLWLNKFAHIDFVSYNIKNLPNKYTAKLNIPLLAWTIKTQEDYDTAKKYANNMIVDNIELLNSTKKLT